MANLLGQTFFLLHDGKLCKEKLEAGPGFQFSTFADRVREISWGRDFKRLNLFFSWQSRGRGFKKLLGTRRAIEEVIGQCLFQFCCEVTRAFCAAEITAVRQNCCDLILCARFCCEVGCAICAAHFTAKSRAHNDFTAVRQNCCDLTCAFCAAYFTANSLRLAFFSAKKNRKCSHSNSSLDFFIFKGLQIRIFSSLRPPDSSIFFPYALPPPQKKREFLPRFPHQNPADMILKTSPRVPYQKQSRDKNEVFASNFPYQMILQKIVRWSLSPGIFPHISVHKKTCQDSQIEGLPCQDFPKIALLDTL